MLLAMKLLLTLRMARLPAPVPPPACLQVRQLQAVMAAMATASPPPAAAAASAHAPPAATSTAPLEQPWPPAQQLQVEAEDEALLEPWDVEYAQAALLRVHGLPPPGDQLEPFLELGPLLEGLGQVLEGLMGLTLTRVGLGGVLGAGGGGGPGARLIAPPPGPPSRRPPPPHCCRSLLRSTSCAARESSSWCCGPQTSIGTMRHQHAKLGSLVQARKQPWRRIHSSSSSSSSSSSHQPPALPRPACPCQLQPLGRLLAALTGSGRPWASSTSTQGGATAHASCALCAAQQPATT